MHISFVIVDLLARFCTSRESTTDIEGMGDLGEQRRSPLEAPNFKKSSDNSKHRNELDFVESHTFESLRFP